MIMVKNVNFIKEKMNQYQIFCVLEGHKWIIIFGQNLEIPDIVPAYLLTYLVVALCTGYLPLCNAAASRRRMPPDAAACRAALGQRSSSGTSVLSFLRFESHRFLKRRHS